MDSLATKDGMELKDFRESKAMLVVQDFQDLPELQGNQGLLVVPVLPVL